MGPRRHCACGAESLTGAGGSARKGRRRGLNKRISIRVCASSGPVTARSTSMGIGVGVIFLVFSASHQPRRSLIILPTVFVLFRVLVALLWIHFPSQLACRLHLSYSTQSRFSLITFANSARPIGRQQILINAYSSHVFLRIFFVSSVSVSRVQFVKACLRRIVRRSPQTMKKKKINIVLNNHNFF